MKNFPSQGEINYCCQQKKSKMSEKFMRKTARILENFKTIAFFRNSFDKL